MQKGMQTSYTLPCPTLCNYLLLTLENNKKKKKVSLELYEDIITKFISLFESEHYCWLQQDGATCHKSNETMNFLRRFFGEHIIFKGLWPPCSSDLTSDFFLLRKPNSTGKSL